MERLANQGQNADPGDLAKDMQTSSASPSSPTAGSTVGSGNTGSTTGNGGGIGEGKGGDSTSNKDDNEQVVTFDPTLFNDGQVFRVNSKQQQRVVGFNHSANAILEKVRWDVLVGSNVQPLGSSNFNSTKRDRELNQLFNVTDREVWLNFIGDTRDFYGDTMQVMVDWTKDGLSGTTKTKLFTATDADDTEVAQLRKKLEEDQKQQGPAETTNPPSSTSGAIDATGSGEPEDSSSSSGGGGLSTGATAGIAVGAVIGGLLLIGALVWFLLRRRRRNKQPSDEYTIQQTYAVDKETHGRSSDSPNSPYSDENHMQPIAIGNVDRDRGVAPTPPPGRSSLASHDRGANSGVQTPQGMSSNVAHLVEDGMTADEIRRLEEEERQLDDEIERAARR
ncbi:hypothetical protein FLONG3_6118 [Fusarium longipes]|uniref:Uncharacterized protein n=1 Tax=Fusarium longipes TaxID=694270 RepID=A0A395SQF4_9HYPO|nr:hypothetical protein FLONG3_6118 [Fusarium longipes]